MELVPLQVRIGLKANRQHDFPPFNELDATLRDGDTINLSRVS